MTLHTRVCIKVARKNNIFYDYSADCGVKFRDEDDIQCAKDALLTSAKNWFGVESFDDNFSYKFVTWEAG